MRPVRLVMQAFEAYADVEVVDFRELGEQTLFLIHGPTGAGKSTLLDAMCFALYGESAGAERSATDLRSHRAAVDLSTRVVFDFALGGDLYRVERYPTQERPKRRGEGVIVEQGKATLWRRTGLTDDAVEGQVVCGKWSEVTEAVERLIGFRAVEFRQVVMLPQGQFQQFLMARSTERQQILETLFQTSYFRRIEAALKDKAASIRRDNETLRTRRATILGQAGVGSLEELRSQIAELNANRASVEAQTIAQRDGVKTAQEALSRGRTALEAFGAHDSAIAELNRLLGEEGAQNERRVRYARAERALSYRDIVHQLDLQESELAVARARLVEAETAHRDAEARRARAAEALKREEARQSERDEAQRRIDDFVVAQQKMVGVEASRREAEEATRNDTEARGQVARLKESHRQCKEELSAAKKEIDRVRQLAGERKALLLEQRALKAAYQNAQKLAEQNRAQREANRNRERLSRELGTVTEALKSAEKRHDATYRNWVKGQAARLAKTLEKGEPCPVCGSKTHPAPSHSRVELPSDEDLDSALNERESLAAQRQGAAEALHNAEKELAVIDKTIEQLRQALGEYVDLSVSEIGKRLKSTEDRLGKATQANETAASLEASIDKLTIKEERLAAQVDDALVLAEKAASRRIEATTLYRERLAEIPKNLAGLSNLNGAIQDARTALDTLIGQLTQARNDDKRCEAAEAAAREGVAGAGSVVTLAASRVETTREAVMARFRDAGFVGLEDYRTAALDESSMQVLKQAIDDYASQVVGAQTRVDDAKRKIHGLERPDLESLESALAQAQHGLEQNVGESGRLTTVILNLEQSLRVLETLDRDIAVSDSAYSVVGRIADIANGNNAQRMTLQSYVLGAFLDEVLMAASVRLRGMSRGRYALQRRQTSADGRARAGLDIDVYDENTGTTRAPATLSGGEQFMASLALALGLADVVTSLAGGMRMDTVFVDEGFGSLDSETLDQAMEILLALQASGRLVGVISHVSELRERISTRLVVVPGASTSHAHFEL